MSNLHLPWHICALDGNSVDQLPSMGKLSIRLMMTSSGLCSLSHLSLLLLTLVGEEKWSGTTRVQAAADQSACKHENQEVPCLTVVLVCYPLDSCSVPHSQVNICVSAPPGSDPYHCVM